MKPLPERNSPNPVSSIVDLASATKLNNGTWMPWIGLGVFQMGDDAATERCVREALDVGYRSIDTAAAYGNERGVGAAVRGCGLPRESLFVTSKVWNDDQRSGQVVEAFDRTMEKLGLDYLDLYLIHWPVPGCFTGAWKALESIYRSGRVKAIGVSNFLESHLETLLSKAEIVPAVNQIEFHPYLRSESLLDRCRDAGIQVTAWSPLMRGALFADPTVQALAKQYGKSAAQIILRWDIQSGVATIPKTAKSARMVENASLFDFSLRPEEMASLNALDRGERSGPDPLDFHF